MSKYSTFHVEIINQCCQEILLDRSAISRIENPSRYVMDHEAVAIARALKVPAIRAVILFAGACLIRGHRQES
jgi:hypothetical protein